MSRVAVTVITLLLALVALPAGAQAPRPPAKSPPPPSAPSPVGPKSLGVFQGWTAAEITPKDGKVCYAVARPAKSDGKYAKRGEVLLVVTHRPAAKSQDVVTFQAGYPLKEGTKISLAVDAKKTFELVARPDVDPESAWAADDKTDKAITAALKSGKSVTVRGASARNTETTDTFALAGFNQAYGAIGKACGVK